jgi:hypothetical protein
MKTITENETGRSKYLFADDKPVAIQESQILVGDPNNLDFIIADLNSGNCTLHENISDPPADWIGNKYTYDGSEWTQDPDWEDAPLDPPEPA